MKRAEEDILEDVKGRRSGKSTARMLISDLDGQALLNAALDQFAIPGDASFPLNQAFEAPRDRQDAESLRQYGY